MFFLCVIFSTTFICLTIITLVVKIKQRDYYFYEVTAGAAITNNKTAKNMYKTKSPDK